MERVWHQFMSPRDLEHLEAGWAKAKPFGLGTRPALVVVDNFDTTVTETRQSVVDAARGANPAQCGEEGWDALERTDELLQAARSSSCRIIHMTIRHAIPTGIFGGMPEDVRRNGHKFHPLSMPIEGELVIEKTYASAFHGTALAAHLIAAGIDTVLVCGNSTSGCVRASALDASQYGFKMAVIEDCTFDRTQASHAMSLFDIDQKYGDVISADEATKYIAECAPST